jgi:hypothetical protein
MKMLLKSNKGSGNFLPLQNIFNYQNPEKFVDDEERKCDLLNKYLSFISKSRYRIDKNNNIADHDTFCISLTVMSFLYLSDRNVIFVFLWH